jgi:hypothetical protein
MHYAAARYNFDKGDRLTFAVILSEAKNLERIR